MQNVQLVFFHPHLMLYIYVQTFAYAWSTKCGRKKPIAHFVCKLQDESFKPNYAMI